MTSVAPTGGDVSSEGRASETCPLQVDEQGNLRHFLTIEGLPSWSPTWHPLRAPARFESRSRRLTYPRP